MTEKRKSPVDTTEKIDVTIDAEESIVESAAVAAEDGEKKGSKKKGRSAKKVDAEARQLAADLAASQDRLLRLQADFENFRKRTHREKTDLYRMANADLLSDILPIVDNFDLALGAVDPKSKDDPFTQGIHMVRDQLLTTLGKFGLKPIEAEAQPFDPNVHEAVSHLPSDEVAENTVIAQTRRGYMLGERLLRAAEVVVSSGPLAMPDGGPAETVES